MSEEIILFEIHKSESEKNASVSEELVLFSWGSIGSIWSSKTNIVNIKQTI